MTEASEKRSAGVMAMSEGKLMLFIVKNYAACLIKQVN
jgi:hypothetical protein